MVLSWGVEWVGLRFCGLVESWFVMGGVVLMILMDLILCDAWDHCGWWPSWVWWWVGSCCWVSVSGWTWDHHFDRVGVIGAWVIMWCDHWWDGRGVLCRWDLMGAAVACEIVALGFERSGCVVGWLGRSIGCDPFLLDMLGLIFMGRMGSLPPPL